jgi:hypothetical protein
MTIDLSYAFMGRVGTPISSVKFRPEPTLVRLARLMNF